MTLSRTMRLLAALLLAGFLLGTWTPTLRAGVEEKLPQDAILLEIKDRARSIEQAAVRINPFLPTLDLRSKADAIAYQARQLYDRAEKLLRP